MKVYVTERKSRDGSQLVRELLRYGYRELYSGDMPEIKKTENGKPYFPDRPDVFFSLSHTDTHVMCAIGEDQVGCDIQTVRQVSDRTKTFVCGREDIELDRFYMAWTARECVVKYRDIIRWKFPPIDSREALLDLFPEGFFYFFKVDGCIATVCADKSASPPEIVYVDI